MAPRLVNYSRTQIMYDIGNTVNPLVICFRISECMSVSMPHSDNYVITVHTWDDMQHVTPQFTQHLIRTNHRSQQLLCIILLMCQAINHMTHRCVICVCSLHRTLMFITSIDATKKECKCRPIIFKNGLIGKPEAYNGTLTGVMLANMHNLWLKMKFENTLHCTKLM